MNTFTALKQSSPFHFLFLFFITHLLPPSSLSNTDLHICSQILFYKVPIYTSDSNCFVIMHRFTHLLPNTLLSSTDLQSASKYFFYQILIYTSASKYFFYQVLIYTSASKYFFIKYRFTHLFLNTFL